MVDVVHLALAVAQLDQRLDHGDDVLVAQGAHGVGRIEVQAHVHLDPADGGEVIALGVEEQLLEQRRGGLDGGRLARAHDAVDVHERGFAVHVLVRRHGVADVRADIDVVDVEHRDVRDALVQQPLQRAAGDVAVLVGLPGQLVAGLDPDLAGFLVDDVLGDEAADDALERHQDVGDVARVDDLLDRARRHLLAGRGDHLAGLGVDDVVRRLGAADPLWEELGGPAVLLLLEADGVVIGLHDAFLVQTQGIQQGGHRQLAAAVDAHVDDVLGVELEVEPRAAIGNDAAGEQELARGMGLAAVVVEEHARRAVHLGDDHPLGAVDDEGAVLGHERHVAHVDVLLLDVLDRLGAGVLVDIEHDQPQRDLQRRAVGHVALLALLDVVFRLLQLVFHEFQDAGLVEILDREHRLEHALDALAVHRLGLVAGIQEQVVGRFLNLDQVRHLRHFADLAVEFADSLVAGMGLNHVRHVPFLLDLGTAPGNRGPGPAKGLSGPILARVPSSRTRTVCTFFRTRRGES